MTPTQRRRLAFTLIELLVVIAILGVLVALLLPAIQKVRESANRTRCINNSKQLGIACLHYNTVNGCFPPGSIPSPAKYNGTDYNYGHSWLVLILPYIEQQNIYNKLDLKGISPHTATGLVYSHSRYGNGANDANGYVLNGLELAIAYCPSSRLSKWGLASLAPPGPIGVFRPTYTAVGGAIDHSSTINRDTQTYAHDAIGRVSFGGVMPLFRTRSTGIRVAQVSDGTSNSMLIAEQSDFCTDSTGARKDCRSDFNHGFAMGPRSNEYRNWNTTSVRYRVNTKNWNLLGVGNDFYAPNRPIQSVHPGGAVVTFGDGSARFLFETVDLQILYNLSNRDDGNTANY